MERIRQTKRIFSESFKRDVVKEIDSGIVSVTECARRYSVSRSSIYKWIRSYSNLYKYESRVIVEKKSATHKTKELEKRIKELEQALGRKQMMVDFYERIIDHHKKETGEDIVKKDERLS